MVLQRDLILGLGYWHTGELNDGMNTGSRDRRGSLASLSVVGFQADILRGPASSGGSSRAFLSHTDRLLHRFLLPPDTRDLARA